MKTEEQWNAFEKDLESLINQHSVDNVCQTPDFLLAEHAVANFKALAGLVTRRESWHGRDNSDEPRNINDPK